MIGRRRGRGLEANAMRVLRRLLGRRRAYLRVGDPAPQNLLTRQAGKGGIGAFVSVDPDSGRILAIFAA